MVTTTICRTWDDSTDARARLWAAIAKWNGVSAVPLKFVTYNGLHFDCPTMEIHQRKDRLPLFGMDIRKYGSKNIIDPFTEIAYNGEAGEQILYRTLPDLAAFFGIETPTDDIKGDQVAGYIAKGDYETVARHCAEDVRMTRELYLRMASPFRAVVFDIETVGRDDIDRTRVKPDGRVSKPEAVEASITEKIAKAGLDPFANRIVVLCYEFVDEHGPLEAF
jgi:hypothetical protein